MIRKIVFILFILCFLSGLGYSYLHFKKKKQPVSNTLSAIPTSAAFIIESKNTITSWGKLSSTNIIWSELQSTEYFADLNSIINAIDSTRLENPLLNQLIQKQPIFISAHMSGANTFDFLFSVSIPNTFTKEEVFEFINSKIKPKNGSSKNYDEVNIYTSTFSSKKASYTCHNGIFVISSSTILIEDAIRQINSGTSLLEITDFQKVVHTAGQNIDANIYINYKVLPNIISTFLNNKSALIITSLTDLANWTEIDLSLKPDAISFNGFTYSNDSINNYMNVFIDQKPQKFEMLDILPKNTACIVRTGFSDFGKFQSRYKTYLEKNNKLFEFGAKLKMLEATYNFNAQRDIYSWIDTEIALIITEPKDEDYTSQSFAVFKSNDIEITEEKLALLAKKSLTINESELDSTSYKGHTIKKIEIKSLLSTLFNNVFNPIKENYYTVIDDFVIFGNTPTSLRDFINATLNKNTISKNEAFENFYDNLSDESNLFIYSNVSRSTYLYKSFLNDEFSKYVDDYEDLYKKFDGIAIQISKDKNNLYYNNVFLHHNPIYKQETSSLWELQLDSTIHTKPQIVLNYKTNTKEIVIQDDANTLYLINNTGKILWKKKLDEPIMGNIHQIDVYKNNKLQLLFNTKSQLHLIDRNGNYVDNYPVAFDKKATSPITLLDYDNNRKYRILAALENNTVVNYEASGKKVKGWKFKTSKTAITTPFKLLQFRNRDYVIGSDIGGNIYVLNRQGKERIELKNKLSPNSNFHVVKKKDLKKSFVINIDSSGTINKLYLRDTLETIVIEEIKDPNQFLFEDLNEDQSKDYIFQIEDKTLVYDQNLNLIYSFTDESTPLYPIQVFKMKSNIYKIGTTTTNGVNLINRNGITKSGFPLFGTTQFCISDINQDNNPELIVGGKNKFIYSYTLEE